MSLVTRLRGYGILTVALMVFSASIFFSFDRMLKEQIQIASAEEGNTVWTVVQSEVALLRVIDGLRTYGNANSTTTGESLQRDLASFERQIANLRTGPVAAKLHEIAGADQTLSDLLARTKAIEGSLGSLAKGDGVATDKLCEDLGRFTAPLHAVAASALHLDEATTEHHRERLRNVYLQLLFYFAGIFLGGTVLLLLLFRGIRRANQLLRDRESTEDRLRESEQRFRDYAASSSDWLWETDAKGRFTYFSKGYLEKVGLSAIEILGRTHEDVAEVEGSEEAWAKQRDIMARDQPFRDFKYRMRTEGSLRHIKVSGVPIFDEDGAFQGYRGTGTDLTAQVEAEHEAERARTLLAEAVESLDEGFAVFDADDRLVQCNGRFRDPQVFGPTANIVKPGVSFEEIIRAGAHSGVFVDAVGREEEWIKARIDHHRNPSVAFDMRLKTGLWIQARETVLENGWRVATRINITHLKQREEGLRREALIWGQMSDGVIVTDLRGNITNWNPAAERMFGYTTADVIGKTPRLLHRSNDQALLSRILDAAEREGRWTGEIDFVRKDGGAGVADVVVVPLRDDLGKRIAVIWVNHDITLRKRSEQELRAAKEQAELANQAKSQFLATMSHEIRTPMNGVLGMVGLLLDTKLDEEQRTYARTIRESGEALITIISDILDFSKMEAGKLELEQADFDLRQTVEAVVDLLAARAQDKGVEVNCYVAPEVPIALKGDAGRLRQILLNLTGNAVKFTDHGGILIAVSAVETTSARARLKFEIIDTGIGIPENLQARLFAEFTQVDPSYARRYGGTGLGLAISKKLAELMNGEIGLSSKLGEGSVFWFTAEFDRRPPKAAETAPAPRLGAARALVVDDNHMTRTVLERQLSAQGLSVAAAAEMHAARAAIADAARKRRPFTFVMIDQGLEDGNSDKLAREMRATGSPETKLILLTQIGDRTDNDAARRSGFDATLGKPVRQASLDACLARLTGATVGMPPTSDESALIAEESARPPAAKPARVVGGELGRARLLMVEDSEVNRMVAIAMLAKSVGQVDTAHNGIEAVEAVKGRDYDLILMDVAMPQMDGLEATKVIRAMPGPKGKIPIIAMTAHAMETDRQRCLAVGMDDYVTKPVDRGKLLETISRWLSNVAPRRQDAPASAPARGAVQPRRLQVVGGKATPQPTLPQSPAPSPDPAAATASHASETPAARAVGSVSAAGAGQDRGSDHTQGNPRPDLDVLDTATLDQLEADTDASVVQELVKTFILETVDRLDRIVAAAGAGNIVALGREAHSLKSSSGTFGARALQEQARAIEAACKAGNAESAAALTRNIRQIATAAAEAMVRHFEMARN